MTTQVRDGAVHLCRNPHVATPRVINGFSLLEALVAMAIASLALGTLYRVVGQGARTASDLDDRVEAAFVARSVLANATFADDLVALGAGQTERWFWQVHVLPENVRAKILGNGGAVALLPVGKVEIDVSREAGGRPSFSLVAWKPYRSAP